MYNEALKNKYIYAAAGEDALHGRSLTSLFNRIEKCEAMYGKDFCLFQKREEVIGVLNFLSAKKVTTVKWNITMLRKYVEWCIVHGYCGNTNNHPLLGNVGVADVDTTAQVKKTMVGSYEELTALLNNVFNEDDSDAVTLDAFLKAAMLLAYEGIKETDLFTMKRSDVFVSGGVGERKLNWIGLPIPIGEETFRQVKRISECSAITIYSQRGSGYTASSDIRGAEKLFLTARVTGDAVVIQYRNRINRRFKNSAQEKSLTLRSIYESGLFKRIYDQEQLGREVSETNFAELAGICTQGLRKFEYNVKVQPMLHYYEMWKIVFYLQQRGRD